MYIDVWDLFDGPLGYESDETCMTINASDEICGVSILSKLNELGQDRWELVSYAYASEVQGGFIFKRQVMP